MVAVNLRRWTRQEYEHLAELGVLGPDERVELVEGEIVEVPPQESLHTTGVRLAEDALRAVYPPGFDIRGQFPLALGEWSEPEPDVAVVEGSPRDFAHAHPTSAVLVVEISDATLAFDRETKASVYAGAGIPEYWVLNLIHRQLEVHRDPGPVPEARYGFGYRTRTIVLPDAEVEVPATRGARLRVADLFP